MAQPRNLSSARQARVDLILKMKQKALQKGLTPGTREWGAYVFGTARRAALNWSKVDARLRDYGVSEVSKKR